MKIPPFLMRRAARAVRFAVMTTTAVAGSAGAASSPTVVNEGHELEARLSAVRQALAGQDAATGAGDEELSPPSRLAQWQNGAGWRNSGWRNS